jgi:hypothetical protein
VSAAFPNYVRFHRGELGNHGNFGSQCRVDLIHNLNGLGHSPHLRAQFEGGLELDWTPNALLAFIRSAQEALAKLPTRYYETSDHVGGDSSC